MGAFNKERTKSPFYNAVLTGRKKTTIRLAKFSDGSVKLCAFVDKEYTSEEAKAEAKNALTKIPRAEFEKYGPEVMIIRI